MYPFGTMSLCYTVILPHLTALGKKCNSVALKGNYVGVYMPKGLNEGRICPEGIILCRMTFRTNIPFY
jgi:hypothetical protein